MVDKDEKTKTYCVICSFDKNKIVFHIIWSEGEHKQERKILKKKKER